MQSVSAQVATIHISNKSHLNITFNLNQCGTGEISPGGVLTIEDEDTFTLLCVREGQGMLEASGLAYALSAPHGIFTFPGVEYELHNSADRPMHLTWLRFSGYLVEHYLKRADITREKPVFGDEKWEISDRLQGIYEASQKLPNRYCRMMAGLYDIFSCLLDRDESHLYVNIVDNANYFAIRAAEYIERNYAKNISVDEIAAALGISRKQLYSVFNDTVKMPPKQYLIYYRIEKACESLKLSTLSIQEISEAVGYASQFYFAKEFKRLTGVTPSEYRKNPLAGDTFKGRPTLPALQEADGRAADFSLGEELMGVSPAPKLLIRREEKK